MADRDPIVDHRTRQAIIGVFDDAATTVSAVGRDFDHENDSRGYFVGKIREGAEAAGLPVRITTYGPEEGETGADIGVLVHSDGDVKGFIAQIKRDDDRRPLSAGVADLKKRRAADDRSQIGHLREFQDASAVLIFARDGASAVQVRDVPGELTTPRLRRAAASISSLVEDFLDCAFGRRGWDTTSRLLYADDPLTGVVYPQTRYLVELAQFGRQLPTITGPYTGLA